MGDVLLWTPTHGRATVGRRAKIYLHHLDTDSGCSLENLLGTIDDRDRSKEREGQGNLHYQCDLKIIYIYIYIYMYSLIFK